MEERLYIKNFGAIKEATFKLKKHMVFIGTQASGKSTIAKLLAIFRDIGFVQSAFGKDYFFNYNIKNYLSAETEFKYSNIDYSINYKNSKWEIIPTPKYASIVDLEFKRIKEYLKTIVGVAPNLTPEQKENYYNQVFNVNWTSYFQALKKPIYIPAERIIVSVSEQAPFTLPQWNLPPFLSEFGIRFFSARNIFNDYKIDFLNIKYKYEINKIKIYLDDTHSISLTESASGFQTSIPVILLIEFFNRNSPSQQLNYIVEEPELNLFPATQKDFVSFLFAKISEKEGSELTMTTHSPYILTALNNLLFAFTTAKKYPQSIDKVKNIVSQNSWINPEDFNAYYFTAGGITQIFNEETGLIDENELDSVSENLAGEFDDLYEIYKAK